MELACMIGELLFFIVFCICLISAEVKFFLYLDECLELRRNKTETLKEILEVLKTK